jgi:polysaccharide pyruvyl transferase WcaK-like protein
MSDPKQMRVALLGATFDTGNMGVGALAASAIHCILKGYPNACVSLLDYASESAVHRLRMEGRELEVPLINMRFSKKFYLPNNIAVLLFLAVLMKAIPSARFRRWITAGNDCLRKIDRIELFTSVAGGDSFSDIYGMARFFYTSLPQVLVLLMGKRLVLLPQTMGPFRRRLSRMIARYILRHAERVFTRDRNGLREMEALLGTLKPGKYSFCYDLAFSLPPQAPASMDIAGLSLAGHRARPVVGVNISGLLYAGGYTRKNMFGLRIDYQEFIRELLRFFIEERGADVLLVPHVFVAADASESDRLENDQAICEQVYTELNARYPGRLGFVRGAYDQSEIKYIIGKCDFLVGSRMHACIAAVSQCIPAVCVAYSDKFLGVMETLGIDSIVADARTQTIPQILDGIGQSFDRREAIRRQLESRMPEVKAAVLNLFSDVPFLPSHGANPDAADSLLPAGTV